jgi:hypothetical protein
MKELLELLARWETIDAGTAARAPGAPEAPSAATEVAGRTAEDESEEKRPSLFFEGVPKRSTPDSMLRVTPEL